MQRFKFTVPKIEQALKYLKHKKGPAPNWVHKYEKQLQVKAGKIFFEDKQIIPRENVDSVLRDEFYNKNSSTPYGRDSAFHILKQKYWGITRSSIMEFIRKQKPLGEVKAALNKPKQSSGEKLKTYVFETDLVFLKKTDLEKSNKKFIRDDIPELSYFLTCVEKVTGLCNFSYVLTKDQKPVSDLVIANCKKLAKQLGTTIKKCSIRSDKGGEFDIKRFEKEFKSAKHVNSGCAVENKNAKFQANFFKILRQRKSTDIEDAMEQSSKMLNNCYNRIHKLTPLELTKKSEKDNVKQYNKTRKSYIAGDKRKPFEVGTYVRLLEKSKKAGIDYKIYKNQTYSEQVYLVKKITKSTPRRYWVNHKWRLQSDLLKSAPRDEISNQLVKSRDKKQVGADKAARKDHVKKRLKEQKEIIIIDDDEEDEKLEQPKKSKQPKRKSKRKAAKKAIVFNILNEEDAAQIDDQLDAIEEGEEKIKLDKHKKELEQSEKKLGIKRKKVLSPDERKKFDKHVAKIKQVSEVKQKYIKFLKKYKLPHTGSEEDLKLRIKLFKRQIRKKMKSKAKVVTIKV